LAFIIEWVLKLEVDGGYEPCRFVTFLVCPLCFLFCVLVGILLAIYRRLEERGEGRKESRKLPELFPGD
jgi:hypothetical protein